MNCGSVRKMLVDYSEDALAGGKKQAVEQHLSHCTRCSGELSQINKLKESISSLKAPDRDAAFWQGFTRRLSQRLAHEETDARTHRPAHSRLSWKAGLSLMAAAFGAMIFVVWLFFVPGEQEHRDAAPSLTQESAMLETIEPADFEPETLSTYAYETETLALAELSSEEIEDLSEDMFLLMNGEVDSASEDMVIDNIYEHTMYDFLEELSAEEFDEMYESVRSI